MHKIITVFVIAFLLGLGIYKTTAVLNINPIENNMAKVFNIDPVFNYDPKTGIYIGVEGYVNLEEIKKQPCWAERQNLAGTLFQIKQLEAQMKRVKTVKEKEALQKHLERFAKMKTVNEKRLADCLRAFGVKK